MISVADVKGRLGIPTNDTLEEGLIQNAIMAAVSYMGHVRPDRDWTAPDKHESEGLAWLVVAIYQEKGRTDSTVDAFTASITPMLGRQVQQMLGLDQFYPPAVA